MIVYLLFFFMSTINLSDILGRAIFFFGEQIIGVESNAYNINENGVLTSQIKLLPSSKTKRLMYDIRFFLSTKGLNTQKSYSYWKARLNMKWLWTTFQTWEHTRCLLSLYKETMNICKSVLIFRCWNYLFLASGKKKNKNKTNLLSQRYSLCSEYRN